MLRFSCILSPVGDFPLQMSSPEVPVYPVGATPKKSPLPLITASGLQSSVKTITKQ